MLDDGRRGADPTAGMQPLQNRGGGAEAGATARGRSGTNGTAAAHYRGGPAGKEKVESTRPLFRQQKDKSSLGY